jgi:hypothetical protein
MKIIYTVSTSFLKFRNKFLLLATLLFVFLMGPVYSQNITMEQTLTYINKKLEGQCKIEVIKGVIIARFFEKNEEFRKDKAAVKELEIQHAGYESEEKIFFIPCKEGIEECVERQLYAMKVKKYSSRLSFVTENNEKTIKGLTEAFGHLAKLVSGPATYSRTEPFE